jgi:hypothetical protein
VVGEPTSELIVDGGEITCFGRAVEYDYKEIIEAEGAVTVRLAIDDLPEMAAIRDKLPPTCIPCE